MNCPSCKKQIPAGSKFCLECGANISTASQQSTAEPYDVSLGAMKTVMRAAGNAVRDPGAGDDASLGDLQTMRPAAGVSDENTLAVQTLSARYELREELGRGGFAAVYKAIDKKLGREVAVKKLHPEHDGMAAARFRREAQAIAALNHRNIVGVYDVGEQGGDIWLVMELIEGGSLREYLRERGKLPLAEALHLFKGIAQGLSYAHRKNLVHRDIKPANILLSGEWQMASDRNPDNRSLITDNLIPKIVDFGLAQAGRDSELSMTGYGMGTPYYMPPEQRRDAKSVNHTADIYALGKVLYEMVTGEIPDTLDPAAIPPPKQLAEIIFKCVKPRPEDRYFSVDDILRELEKIGGQRSEGRGQRSATSNANACPQCGAENAPDVKFCEACGTGLTRNCPECGRENSVHKQFCGSCGTDTEGFRAAQETLSRMRQFAAEKKWSRVTKEYGLFNKDLRLPGKKGADLRKDLDLLAVEAEAGQKQIEELSQEIAEAMRDEARYEQALELIEKYRQLDEEREWTEPITMLQREIEERDYSRLCTQVGALQAEMMKPALPPLGDERLVPLQKWIELYQTFEKDHPASPHLEHVRSEKRTVHEKLKKERDNLAFDLTQFTAEPLIAARRYDEAQAQYQKYLKNFSAHRDEAARMIEEELPRLIAQREEELRQIRRRKQRVAALAGAAILLTGLGWFAADQVVLAVRKSAFNKAVETRRIAEAQVLAGKLRGRHDTSGGLKALDRFYAAKKQFDEASASAGALLNRFGGAEWAAVQELVKKAEMPGDPGAGAKLYNQALTAFEPIRNRLHSMLSAKGEYEKSAAAIGDRGLNQVTEKHVRAYALTEWYAAQQAAKEAEAAATPEAAASAYRQAAAALKGAVEKVMNTPATVAIVCNAPGVQIANAEQGMMNAEGGRIRIPPFKEHTFEIRAKGYITKTLTLAAAEPGEDLGTKHIVLEEWRGPQEGKVWIADLGSGVSMEFMPIKAGSFQMGSANGDSDEKPVHRVTLTNPFWMAKTEVTQGQWQQVMGSNPSNWKGADLPVEQVSWNDAVSFCKKLTDRERQAGRLPEGFEYTLPTEAQWEYACRAGTTGDYAGNLDSMAWYDSNSGSKTHAVGTKQPNAWGLYDMHGNVWEWCADWYGDYPSGSVTDPRGASSGSGRVFRGGGWGSGASDCRSAYRNWPGPSGACSFLGFRACLVRK